MPPRTVPGNRELCDLVRCLVADDGIRRWLEMQHIDPKTLARCVEGACPHNAAGAGGFDASVTEVARR